MPELPEVETVRRQIAPALEGARIMRAVIDDVRLTRPLPPEVVAAALRGEHVTDVARRGKYLVIRLESRVSLLVHLRMTGSFLLAQRGSLEPDAHRRAVLTLDNDSDVAYRDVRRFGTWELVASEHEHVFFATRLGPEPLDASFSANRLGSRLDGRRAPLKAALLDQRTLAGLGNIYVDEALWRAQLSPLRPAGGLTGDELRRLHRAVRAVLRLGIERQGASLRDYATPGGDSGTMQEEFVAYGRAGEPCERCGSLLARVVVGGRGTTYCPTCQPMLG